MDDEQSGDPLPVTPRVIDSVEKVGEAEDMGDGWRRTRLRVRSHDRPPPNPEDPPLSAESASLRREGLRQLTKMSQEAGGYQELEGPPPSTDLPRNVEATMDELDAPPVEKPEEFGEVRDHTPPAHTCAEPMSEKGAELLTSEPLTDYMVSAMAEVLVVGEHVTTEGLRNLARNLQRARSLLRELRGRHLICDASRGFGRDVVAPNGDCTCWPCSFTRKWDAEMQKWKGGT